MMIEPNEQEIATARSTPINQRTDEQTAMLRWADRPDTPVAEEPITRMKREIDEMAATLEISDYASLQELSDQLEEMWDSIDQLQSMIEEAKHAL